MAKPIQFPRVTSREKELIKHLAKGLTANQIGQRLNISPTTVITHRNKLRNKLKCKNCPELVYASPIRSYSFLNEKYTIHNQQIHLL